MHRWLSLPQWSPLLVIVLIAGTDLALGPAQVVLGLVVVAPLLAGGYLSPPVTAWYAAAALAVAIALGFADAQYTAPTWQAQAVRLLGVAIGGGLAIVVAISRQRREAEVFALVSASAQAREDNRQAQLMARLAETLQMSLLTDPPQLDHLEIAARYIPAAEHVKIGGDWYDAFPAPGGRTMLVIGDVAGHDRVAAAAMAQVRHTLRGITQTLHAPPAAILDALDVALRNLDPTVMATMILAEVTHDEHRPDQPLSVVWANAGHPPPLVLRTDGDAELLEHDLDPLIGLAVPGHRRDHHLPLGTGDILTMFTDGLVERRGSCIDDGLNWVTATAAAASGRSLIDLCDALMKRVTDQAGDDDAALIAVRARPRRQAFP